MASSELILSETECQNLLLFKGYIKQLFHVDVRRQDDGYESVSGGLVEGSSMPSASSLSLQGNDEKMTPKLDSELFRTGLSKTESDEFVLRPPPVIVHIQTDSTDSSHSNLEKCRKFSIACCPSATEFKYIKIKLESQKSLDMVKACLPSIRQSTATLINIYPESLDITVQGHHRCVDEAQNHIDMVLKDYKSDSSETQTQRQFNMNSNHPLYSCFGDENAAIVNTSNIDIQNSHHHLSDRLTTLTTSNVSSSPAKSDDSVFFSGEQCEEAFDVSALSNVIDDGDIILTYSNAATNNDTPFQAYTKPCQEKFLLDCTSDFEQDNILADDRFSNHIVQATKLGFSEEQITKVLRKLGVNASMEDMMRELVMEPQGLGQKDDPMRLEEQDSSEINGEGSDDSEGFDVDDSSNLRHIIIDGSNVAMSHGQKVFSCLGIKIVVDWFKNRGHKNITAFVPQWRKEASRPDAPITDQEILTELEAERIVVFTPSRRVGGTRIVCYDDRYVLQLAVQKNGIVVSNDVYRDLVRERDDFKEVVEKRLLMYSFVQDMFMPPEDPLGRQGPSLDNFLRIKPLEPKIKPQICPYGKKCTYGNKCRYYHPERRYTSQKMVAEKLKESAELKLKSGKVDKIAETSADKGRGAKQKLFRTVSLVPQDMGNIAKSEVTSADKTKKPVLTHSKSLVYPSSYLTDFWLKMEEAESAENFGQAPVAPPPLPHQEVKPTQTHTVVSNTTDGNCNEKLYSVSCSPSPRTSPTPQTDLIKAKVKAVRSFPSLPVPTVPSALTVNSAKPSFNLPSNPEPRDRYLSGHLLVVKRLSDEDNNNGNFFSEHTSRATGSFPEGNQVSAYDGNIPSQDSDQIPVSHVLTSQHLEKRDSQESNQWSAQEIYLSPEMSTQVGYDQKKSSSKVVSPSSKFLPSESECNSSVMHFFPPNSEQCYSCPTFTQSDGVCELPQQQQQQQQYFKRSLSTNTPPQTVEPSGRPLRKYSLNTISTNAMEQSHAKVKYHSSMPPNQRMSYNQHLSNVPPYQSQLSKTRMSVDSGISSGGLSVDHSLINSPFSPTEHLSSPFSYTPDMSSPVGVSPLGFKPTRPVMQPQETMYTSSSGSFSSPTVPLQFSPLPNRMPSFFQDKSNMQKHVSTQNLSFQTQHPPIYRPPPPMNSMAPYSYMAYPPPNQPQSQSPHLPSMVHPENQYYSMTYQGAGDSPLSYSPSTPLSPFLQPPPFSQPQSKLMDEDAPINVEDPRYSVYYNLSSVFGERAVRTFMNRNPDVRNFNELYSLIASYKQEMGI